MTDEVAALVLRDNYLQTQAISVTHALGAHLLDRLARFMQELERAAGSTARLEFLPDDETTGRRARRQGSASRGRSCAVLLAYAKIALYDELLASDLPDDPYLQEDLEALLPDAAARAYRGRRSAATGCAARSSPPR